MSDLDDLNWQGPDDSEEAARWRGQLFPFGDWNLFGARWRDAQKGHYCSIEPPGSVTFPICSSCGRIVWTWPHFEEPVPQGAACDHCAREAEEDAAREAGRW